MHLRKKSTLTEIAIRSAGFTLVETLVSLFILGVMSSGLLAGYVQINRMAEWSAMSLAAQSVAAQGAELAKAANWTYLRGAGDTNYGYYASDQLGYPPSVGYTNLAAVTTNTLDIPASGADIFVTNTVSINDVFTNCNPPLRQIRSDAIWTFPMSQTVYTNTVITLRSPDQ